MNAATVERYQSRLRDIRSDLVDEFQSDADAIAQDVQPPGDVTSVPTHPADQDSEGVMERVGLGEIERDRLEEIDEALQRIDEGTFGTCQSCGNEISQERLDAVPYTAYCISCAEKMEESE